MGVAFVISSALPASEVIEVDRQNRQARRNAGRFVSHPRGRVGRLILVAPWTPWAFQSRPAENR